jgi:hypothetical protein
MRQEQLLITVVIPRVHVKRGPLKRRDSGLPGFMIWFL